jgi:hypothetical protein
VTSTLRFYTNVMKLDRLGDHSRVPALAFCHSFAFARSAPPPRSATLPIDI